MNTSSFNPKSAILVVGQVVYTNLYNLGRGVIAQIHGEQSPKTSKAHFGGVLLTGGKADFDIVFECGKESKRLPECILRGVQWTIHEEVVALEEIERIRQVVKDTQEKEAQEQAAENAAYSLRKIQLADDPKYKHLIKVKDGSYGHAVIVAKNLRIELKANFPKTKFSVRKTDYSSISINWVDGPTTDQVRELANKYKTGYYDMYADMHESKDSPFTANYGGVTYLNYSRDYSDALKQKAIDILRERFGVERVPESCTVEAYTKGGLWSVGCDFFSGHGVGGEIGDELRKLQA